MQQICFKKEGMQHYMVVSCTDKIQRGYEQRLLQYHEVPYILPCEYRNLNGEQWLYYRLQYRTTLKTALPYLTLTKKQLIEILKSIVGVLETLEEYLLDVRGMLWQPECIFMEADTGKLQFCYMPGALEPEKALRELLTALMQTDLKKEEEGKLLLLQFYDLITDSDCTLQKLKDYIKPFCNEQSDFRGLMTEKPETEEEKIPETLPKKAVSTENEKPLKRVTVLLITAAAINIIFILCLLCNVLAYAYMRYLFVTMGFLVLIMIVYMNMLHEDSPDEIMQAYFKEQLPDTRQENKMPPCDHLQPGQVDLEEQDAVYYGETTILTGAENVFEQKVLEEEGQRLYLEALEPGKYEPIHVNHSIVLGCMEEGCSYILKDRGISRMHAKLMEKADGLYLLDLNSTNGTYLNGQMIESGEDYKIEAGDHVAFAKSEFYVAVQPKK